MHVECEGLTRLDRPSKSVSFTGMPIPAAPKTGESYNAQSRTGPGLRPGLQSPVPELGRRTGGQSQSPTALCVAWARMDGHQYRPPHHKLSLPLASMRRGVAGTIKKLTCGAPKASPPLTPPTAMQ